MRILLLQTQSRRIFHSALGTDVRQEGAKSPQLLERSVASVDNVSVDRVEGRHRADMLR